VFSVLSPILFDSSLLTMDEAQKHDSGKVVTNNLIEFAFWPILESEDQSSRESNPYLDYEAEENNEYEPEQESESDSNSDEENEVLGISVR
jgi:hypothetical protein